MLIKGSNEDIIYIIIGVLWIAYSIYKGTQKSKARNEKKGVTRQLEKKEKKSVFETFLDDILVEEKPATFVPYEQNVQAKESEVIAEIESEPENIVVGDAKEGKIFSYDDYYEEGNFQEETGVINHDGRVAEVSEKKIKTATLKNRKKPRFDLRKAVVYSEILNRRYF